MMSEGNLDDQLSPFEPQRGHSSDEIVRRLIRAVFEHRLAPGTQITEGKLSDTFKVSRTLVRQAISQLCEMQVVVKKPNQTCIVAHPSREDTRALLDVRRIIEPQIVVRAVQSALEVDIAVLEAHLIEESGARASGNRAAQVRLSGEFHLKIAEIARNPFLTRIMMQLQVLTCLAVLVHAKGELGCLRDEHERIVQKIRARDAAGAAAEMVEHLQHIENDLQLNDDADFTPEQAFQWLAGEVS
jgi:DNA-binding GntR family transcriptional regulator